MACLESVLVNSSSIEVQLRSSEEALHGSEAAVVVEPRQAVVVVSKGSLPVSRDETRSGVQ